MNSSARNVLATGRWKCRLSSAKSTGNDSYNLQGKTVIPVFEDSANSIQHEDFLMYLIIIDNDLG